MSYKTLYRKYRPHTFDDVVGQDHIILTLKNIIENDKVSHAYLFTGPRGTGKTSVANVFAKEVNRKQSGSIDIDAFDIVEIDAASNNGVAEVRNLIANSKYAPSGSKYKVYIVDEVHMLSKGAFNALLKTLEDPPKRVIFILATTEPYKIPVTILSRTQRFNFRRIDLNDIVRQLKKLLDLESIKYEEEALTFIAKLAQGGLRDALSIADQAAAFGNNKISFEDISQVFGIISVDNQIKVLNLAYKNHAKELIILINELIENGIDLDRLTSSLIDLIKDYIFIKKTNDFSLSEILKESDFQKVEINLDFAYLAVEELIVLLGNLRFSQIPKQIFELSLLKITNSQKKYYPDEKLEAKEEAVPQPQNETGIENVLETSEQYVKAVNTTDEIKIEATHQVESAIENIAQTQEIENDILSSQAEDITPDPQVEKTDEMDLEQMFNIDESTEENAIGSVEAATSEFSEDSIVNLLLQGKKEEYEAIKARLMNIGDLIDEAPDPIFVSLLKKVKFISCGEKFLLVSSEEDPVISQLNDIKTQENFIVFISKVFKKPLHLFAITKEEFDKVIKKWVAYNEADNFPPVIELKDIIIKAPDKTQAQKLHEDIFGDLFK